MAEPQKSLLPVAASIVGMLVGGMSVYWTTRDRMRQDIEDRVKLETDISALKQQVKSLEGDVWNLKTRTP